MKIYHTANETSAIVEKKPYASPKITVLGDIAEITLGSDLGDELDAMFTVNTNLVPKGRKKKDLLFS